MLKLTLPFALVTFAACSSSPTTQTPDADPVRVLATATANMEGRSGTTVAGTVTFTERRASVGGEMMNVIDVRYNLTGITPGDTRGFHVHDVGDCSAPDASSAGGHFNPSGHEHGAMDHPSSHAGDLGNITANPAGRAEGVITGLTKFTLQPGPNSIVGRGLIVHAQADDYTTQPTGNAGARVSCGIIALD